MYRNYKVLFGPIKQGHRTVELWREGDPDSSQETTWTMGSADLLDLTFDNGKLAIRWPCSTKTAAKLSLTGEDVINEWLIGIAPEVIDLKRFTPRWIEGKKVYAGFLPD